ncbi:hypothetical protein PHJA_001197800 [Phtheirospermum japonicum]|uniref:F-box domain-containing protein n=1 Tax=Phtheirospermum japonicum TaxID=374723 RepID=A0A830BW73_9LAMI|nr:hypothetical protein PHJA_001197800 [Phtheirospermum japonicum]
MERTNKVADAKKQDSTIDDLPDDVIVDILSRIHRREAVRTSVLSRRWRYLSSFCSSPGTLKLDYRDLFSSADSDIVSSGKRVSYYQTKDLKEKYIEWVNRVLELHQDMRLDCLIIRSPRLESRYVYPYHGWDPKPGEADDWIFLAMHKKVKMFELEVAKSLRLVSVDIEDEVVHYFLASCPYLEQLCIRDSHVTKNLRVVDPLQNLKDLEISNCQSIQSVEIFVTNLVSCTYEGGRVIFPFKEIPNLSELTIGGDFARSFIYEPKKHTSYSAQLVKLALSILNTVSSQPLSQRSPPINYHNNGGSESSDSFLRIQRPDLSRLCSLKYLELNLMLPVGKSIHFFAKFINASPLLKELTIKISYMVTDPRSDEKLGFPEESPSTKLEGRRHKNLKVVKMSGYVGGSSDDKFILRLLNIAQSLETVAIDTESEYYDQTPWDCAAQCPKERRGPCGFCTTRDIGARTRIEAKRRAKQLKSSFPPKTKAELIVT